MNKERLLRITAHGIFSRLFAILFLALSAAILLSTISGFIQFIATAEFAYKENEIPEIVVNAISNLIIALAMFELFLVINIDIHPDSRAATIRALLDSAPRFIVVVCVALALEGLVLVIKLSQGDRIDELLLPICVIASASLLLVSLGVFLKICSPEVIEQRDFAKENDPDAAE